MKKAYLATAVLSAVLLTACGSDEAKEDASASTESAIVLENEAQKQSYALGASMGMFVTNRFETQEGLNIATDLAALRAGFEDGLKNNQQMTMEDIQFHTQASDTALRAAQTLKAEQDAAAAIEAGKAFLAENALKEGVTVTESGLQYEVVKGAEGASPAVTDTVTVHYRGTLIDGTEFDSSYSRGEPTSFPLNRVISGWTEGLQLMPLGSTYRFYIPSELAYGQRGQGAIPANSTLIFDVELLEIKSAE
ncbi:FKBP-type peptidyl-prolyl cis-trans isomerase [Glaciecola sp. SC05]|uniref:FKBP-type peptidyl-prolyl cis-trans isomerase n=1 Tax=Glaciecola sp. SC05 TaxID=1987355 RepID=UPI00352780D4